MMTDDVLAGLVTFIKKAENLKNTLRSAHTSNGRRESTAEHSWRLCLLVMVLAGHFEGVDAGKLLKLSVVHDLGEAICGDIPANHQSPDDNKSEKERAAMLELSHSLPEEIRAELLALWDEYDQAATPEAKIIKALDKLETIIQHNQGENLPGFDYRFNLAYGQEHMDAHPLLRQLRDMLDKETTANAEASESAGR